MTDFVETNFNEDLALIIDGVLPTPVTLRVGDTSTGQLGGIYFSDLGLVVDSSDDVNLITVVGQTYTVTANGYSDNNSYNFELNGVQVGNDAFLNGASTFTYTFVATSTLSTFSINGIGVISDTNYTIALTEEESLFAPTQGDDNGVGTEGNDTVDLLGGNDHFDALGGNDYIAGGAGNDTLDGGAGFDDIYGGDGEDRIIGGAHIDYLFGGNGNDNISAGSGDDLIYGGAGHDGIGGNFGDDLIYAENGNDAVRGGSGDDEIYGGDGKDNLFGDSGNDIISGGDGNDKLHGGEGTDVFVFSVGDDADYIRDFNVFEDKIELRGIDGMFLYDGDLEIFPVYSYQEYASQVGNDVVLDFGGGDTLTLANVDMEDLTSLNFTFNYIPMFNLE